MKVNKHSLRRPVEFLRVGDIFSQRQDVEKTVGKWQKCKFYFGLHGWQLERAMNWVDLLRTSADTRV